MPELGGNVLKKLSSARSPPAEAPTPTTGNGGCFSIATASAPRSRSFIALGVSIRWLASLQTQCPHSSPFHERRASETTSGFSAGRIISGYAGQPERTGAFTGVTGTGILNNQNQRDNQTKNQRKPTARCPSPRGGRRWKADASFDNAKRLLEQKTVASISSQFFWLAATPTAILFKFGKSPEDLATKNWRLCGPTHKR